MQSSFIQRLPKYSFRIIVILISLFSSLAAWQSVNAQTATRLDRAAFQVPTPTYGACPPSITVISNLDSGTGTLRQAIDEVCDGGTITIPGSLTISIQTPLLVAKNLTIDGTDDGATLDAQSTTHILIIQNPGVTIKHIHFTNGLEQNAFGGALTVQSGVVSIEDSIFTNNGSSSVVDSTGLGGAIVNNGTLNIKRTSFINNVESQTFGPGFVCGGAIFNTGNLTILASNFISNIASNRLVAEGGAICNNSGQVTVADSLFQSNMAVREPGGLAFGGAIFNGGFGTMTVDRTTMLMNSGTEGGGAIANLGSLTVTNSTIVRNGADTGTGGGIYSSGALLVDNSTLSHNMALIGGGLYLNTGSSITLAHTIIANSTNGDCVNNIAGGMTDNILNLIEDGTCSPSFSGDPLFADNIADLGGLTPTLALLPGSPAIDTGGLCVLPVDQRGMTRPAGSACDIGAFESRGFTLEMVGGNSQSTEVGTAFTNPLQVQVSPVQTGEPVQGGEVTFTGPASGASINPNQSSVVIAANGSAELDVTANNTPGSYTVSASTQGATPISFNLTNTDVVLADLAVALTDGITNVNPGGSLTYTLIISNSGPSAVVGATLQDTFPTELTGVSFTATGTGGANGFTTAGVGNINETGINMPVGSSITYTITAGISASASGSISNTATVSTPSGVVDPNSGNNTATDTDSVNPATDLEITIGGNTTVLPGASLIYIISIKNNGPNDAQNVSITGSYPPGTTFVSFTQSSGPLFSATGTPGLIATISTLSSGATAEFELVLNQPADSTLGWGYSDVIYISSSTHDIVSGNNTDYHYISVSERPTVTIEQAPAQLDPTNVLPIRFIATFSNGIANTSFTSDDLTITTTAPGALTTLITEAPPNDSTVFEISIIGFTGPGLVQVNLADGKVQNPAGLTNPASTSTDNTVYFDQTSPLVTDISLDAMIIGKGPKTFTVQFNKAVQDPAGNDGEDDVTNPDNYLIVTPGLNTTYQTTSCMQGLMGDDVQVIPQSVSYSATDFLATVYLNANLPTGIYRLFVCGSTSIIDLAGNPLNSGVDMQFNFEIQPKAVSLPSTGFPMGIASNLLAQPLGKAYTTTTIQLVIPDLNLNTSVVGVPVSEGSWDVSWLGDQAGWLAGSAYPTTEGNTVITGHVWSANNNPGIFWGIKDLQFGDEIVLRVGSDEYVYQVQKSELVAPDDVNSVLKPTDKDWLTLLTCEKYNPETKTYPYRRMVRAVLIDVR